MGEEQEQPEQEALKKEPQAAAAAPMTLDEYRIWKQRKDSAAAAAKLEQTRKREQDIATGRVRMNGRELYEREPWVFDDSMYD